MRDIIFRKYWSLPSQSEKYNFIARCVSEIPKQKNAENVSRRTCTRKYTLRPPNHKVIPVCQTMFLNTLGITTQPVNTAMKKLRLGAPTLKDQRGSGTRRPRAIDTQITDNVIQHINMFPRVESHYIRKDSSREYLAITGMYRLYKLWATESGLKQATFHHYADTFNTKFNIGFFKPKKDQCDLCEAYENGDDEVKTKLKNKYDTHQSNKNFIREYKKRGS